MCGSRGTEEVLVNWSGQEVGVTKVVCGCGQGQFMGVGKYHIYFYYK